jgi:hypothetical protein
MAFEPTRLALQRKDAAAALSISADSFDRHVRPHLRCCYIGEIRLWPVAELDRWLDSHAMLPGSTASAPATAPTAPGHDQGGTPDGT